MNIRFIIMMSMLFLISIEIIAQSNFPPKEFRVKEDIIVQFERSNGTVYQHNKGMDNWIELSNTNDKDGFAKLAAKGRDYRGRSATIYTDNSGREFKSYDGTHWITLNESQDAIQVESENLALQDNEYLSSFDIYPNPANETITVTFVLKTDVAVKAEINTLDGKTVMELASEKLKSGKYDLRNNISTLKAGVYLYTLKIGDEYFTKQLLIK